MVDAMDLTVSDTASPVETNAVCRAVLTTIWSGLTWFTIDLTDLGGTPGTDAAVAALGPYRERTLFRRRPTQEAMIDLADRGTVDEVVLDAVLTLATLTPASAAWSAELNQLAYNVDDEGTSCYFFLTAAQRVHVDERLRSMAVSTELLVLEP